MIELKVEGMSCVHWIRAVTEALSRVPGAAKVHEVDLEQGRARVGGFAEPGSAGGAGQRGRVTGRDIGGRGGRLMGVFEGASQAASLP